MIALLLIGGMIMTMLGVIGEYVWRINEDVGKRPNYLAKGVALDIPAVRAPNANKILVTGAITV